MVERGKSGWALGKIAAAARALDVSSDFLLGLTDDPTPAGELARALAAATAAAGLGDPAARAAAFEEGDYVGVSELASAAGDGAVVEQERVTGRVKFRRAWLARHGLVARNCRVIEVSGESMEPTLVDGCSILVNLAGRRRRVGRIYVVRTGDGPRRQARRQGPIRRLADRQRQPQQARLAHAPLAARRRDRRRGQVGREDVRMKERPYGSHRQ